MSQTQIAAPMPLDRFLDGLDVEVKPLGALPLPLVPDDALVLACGTRVQCSSACVTIVPPPRRVRLTVNGEAPPPRVRIRVTYQGSMNLFDHLPGPLVEAMGDDDPIRRCFHELLDELAAIRPGTWAMVATLLRRFLILTLRRCCERAGGRPSWLAVVADARLGRAVAAMHERPDHDFTLAELAEVAGMSRTVFAARFAETLAQPPIEFLKTLRLQRAAQLLARTDLPVKMVAAQVGYSSRSSFTRAFFACHGAAPKAFRASAYGMSA
jgi:AraC-like DNA-binding protein